MTGRDRVEAALGLGMADRPPVGAWGHTYREEWSPDALAEITVGRARHFGWDFVKFQPRASTFAEAFGSVYEPSGHRMRAPVLVRQAVPDLDAWASVALVNEKALEDQVESIGIVARSLGPNVPVIQTVFSPLTVGGYLVGKSQSRVVRELRKHPEVVGPALKEIADTLIDFSRRSVEAGAAGIFICDLGVRGSRCHARARVPRPGAAIRPGCAGRVACGRVVQRRPPLRVEPELRPGARSAFAGGELVHPTRATRRSRKVDRLRDAP